MDDDNILGRRTLGGKGITKSVIFILGTLLSTIWFNPQFCITTFYRIDSIIKSVFQVKELRSGVTK